MLTGFTLAGMANLIYQKKVEGRKQIDKGELLMFSIQGFLLGGAYHFWYLWLDHVCGAKMTLVTAFKKSLLNHGIFAFFDFAFETDSKKALTISYSIHASEQFINFYFVPEQFRVLYSFCLPIIWTYLVGEYLNVVRRKKA